MGDLSDARQYPRFKTPYLGEKSRENTENKSKINSFTIGNRLDRAFFSE